MDTIGARLPWEGSRTAGGKPQRHETDPLTEGIYSDRGCRLHPRCLTCPLPRCIYDLPREEAQRLLVGQHQPGKWGLTK